MEESSHLIMSHQSPCKTYVTRNTCQIVCCTHTLLQSNQIVTLASGPDNGLLIIIMLHSLPIPPKKVSHRHAQGQVDITQGIIRHSSCCNFLNISVSLSDALAIQPMCQNAKFKCFCFGAASLIVSVHHLLGGLFFPITLGVLTSLLLPSSFYQHHSVWLSVCLSVCLSLWVALY